VYIVTGIFDVPLCSKGVLAVYRLEPFYLILHHVTFGISITNIGISLFSFFQCIFHRARQ